MRGGGERARKKDDECPRIPSLTNNGELLITMSFRTSRKVLIGGKFFAVLAFYQVPPESRFVYQWAII